MSARTITIALVTLSVFALAICSASAEVTLTPQQQLGKDIFFDTNLSINGNQSCAACHAPEVGWTGPDSMINAHGSVYEGSIPGRFGNRKPPSSGYATQSPILHMEKGGLFVGGNFWDGRATGETLGSPSAEQAQGPFLNPLEQALGSAADVIGKICLSAYMDLFLDVCGETACDPANVSNAYNCVGFSVAAYEASQEVNQFSSKFDAVMVGKAKFTKLEREGFSLFMGKGKCNRCHVMPPLGKPVLFTDFTFDNLGVPKNPENPFYLQLDFNPLGANWIDRGLGGFLFSRSDYMAYADANYGKHKVPTLRNVDKRPAPDFVKAFGHNGYFKSLKRIVHFYNTRDVMPQCATSVTDVEAASNGCWPPPEVSQNMNMAELGNLGLTEDQEWALVEFMKTLSDGWVSP